MKNVKRALAMCFALALLLSFSPVFNVNAVDTETESEYNTIMHNLKPTADETNMLDSTYVQINGDSGVIKATDSEELAISAVAGQSNSYEYVTFWHPKTALQGNYIFEAEIYVAGSGQTLEFYSRNNKQDHLIISLVHHVKML